MDRRANSSRAGNDPRSSFFFFCSLAILFRVYFHSFFFQTVLFYFFLLSSSCFSLSLCLVILSGIIRRAVIVAFERKVGRMRQRIFFFFSRISLLLPFRCLEISLSFFFSKEFTIKYLRISMYNRVVALLIE